MFTVTQILHGVTWTYRPSPVPRGCPACDPWRSSFPVSCAAACGRCAGLGCCPSLGRCPGRYALSNGADCLPPEWRRAGRDYPAAPTESGRKRAPAPPPGSASRRLVPCPGGYPRPPSTVCPADIQRRDCPPRQTLRARARLAQYSHPSKILWPDSRQRTHSHSQRPVPASRCLVPCHGFLCRRSAAICPFQSQSCIGMFSLCWHAHLVSRVLALLHPRSMLSDGGFSVVVVQIALLRFRLNTGFKSGMIVTEKISQFNTPRPYRVRSLISIGYEKRHSDVWHHQRLL